MCLDKYPGGRAQGTQREGMGIQWGSSSLGKSLTCSDLVRRVGRSFHHDIDYTQGAGRRDDLVIPHHLKNEKKIKPQLGYIYFF